MSALKPRCLLVGRSNLHLEGLACLLGNCFEIRVSGVEARIAVAALGAVVPDVVVVDVEIDEAELEVARLLACTPFAPPVICLIREDIEPVPGLRYLQTTACTAADLLETIQTACGVAVSAPAYKPDSSQQRGLLHATDDVSSQREVRIAEFLALGFAIAEIGEILNLPRRTVAFYKFKIMERNKLIDIKLSANES